MNQPPSPSTGFWLAPQPLVLASKSLGRRLVLEQTGIPFVCRPADLDERAIETEVLARGGGADDVVLALAVAKAAAVSGTEPQGFVLGADQAASCEGRIFGKPASRREAAEQLRSLSGRTHRLHSAVALFCDGRELMRAVIHADLDMRPLSESFLDAYLDAMGEAALASAGAYQIEGLGAHLFPAVRGDHWTIMGLPLPPVLAALRDAGVLLR